MRACVIFNPAAKGQKAERFQRCLATISAEAVLKRTDAPGAARRLATAAVAEGFDTVIAAGGDGTVNEVLNGLGDAPDGFARARLGVLPLGTVNVFARELALPLQPESAWIALRSARELAIDLPYFESIAPPHTRTYFVQLAGTGLDARAIELVNWNLKKQIGPLAYVVAGLKAMNQPHPHLELVTPDQTWTGELILIGNGQRYGGSYRIFPAANFADGKLDARVFPRVTWGRLLRCGLSLLFRGRLPDAEIAQVQSENFILRATPSARFEVDGELGGSLPAQVGLVPRGLRILAPSR